MNINATLLAQAVVMIVFVAICWKYVYPPILSMMKEREKRISDGLEAAKKADDSLEEAKLAFDKELNQAKLEASEILKKQTQELLKLLLMLRLRQKKRQKRLFHQQPKLLKMRQIRLKKS